MKKLLAISFLLWILVIVGCDMSGTETIVSSLQVTGTYQFYEQSPNDYWQQDKKGLICFNFPDGTFKQNENNQNFLNVIGNWQEFCFTNTVEAKQMLKIPAEGSHGSGTFVISNITKRKVLESKDDSCIEKKNCRYNEATLMQVLELTTDQDWQKQQAELKEKNNIEQSEINSDIVPNIKEIQQ